MTIDQLAARLARMPRPEIYRSMSDAEYSDGLSTIIADLELLARKDGCIAAAFALSFFDAATSYPVVRPEDVKRGEWYWAKAPSGEWLIRRPAYFNGGVYFTGFGITDDPNAPSYKYKPVPAMKCEIRGPIPRPE